MATDERERNEKLGRTVVGITWILFAARFIIIVSVIALAVLYFMGKPLWLAPVIGVVVFAVYRLIWNLIWRFIGWSTRQ